MKNKNYLNKDKNYKLRMFMLFLGKPHFRYSIKLLGFGVLFLSPNIIDYVSLINLLLSKLNINLEIAEISVNMQNWTLILGSGCIVMSIIIFIIFQLRETSPGKKSSNLPLGDPIYTPSKTLSALKYGSQTTQFIGREDELLTLSNFMSLDKNVSWWAISGKGGSGKSRLALELCNIYDSEGWKCGFYDDQISKSALPNWNPDCAQLVIIDYAASWKSESPLEVIKYAIQLNETSSLSYPIRILLIDRDAVSTIDNIVKTQIFGEKIKNYLYEELPLDVKTPNLDTLKSIVIDLCEFFELTSSDSDYVMNRTLNSKSNRKILVAGLEALNCYMNDQPEILGSLDELINKLIDDERNKHWDKLGFDLEKEQYLIAATIADGIYIKDTSTYGPDAIAFIESFNFKDIYRKVVGESADERLAPLSHDIVSELQVLEYFDPDNNSDREKFNYLVKICLQIDHGCGLVNFFTRAANDFIGHPALQLLLQRFGQSEELFTIWLALIGNIIDKIEITLNEKISLFNRVVWGVVRDRPKIIQSLIHLFDGFFLRVLREATNNADLDYWVRDYSIRIIDTTALPPSQKLEKPEAMFALSEIAPGLMLKPKDYCNAVLASLRDLNDENKKLLLWHGVFEVYHHSAMHLSVDRETDLTVLNDLLEEIINTFDNNWSILIIFKDVVTCLIQFGRHHKNKEGLLLIVEHLLEEADVRNNNAGRPEFLATVSSAYGHAHASYDKKMNLLAVWDRYYSADIFSDEIVGTNYVANSVSFMHGFQNDKNNLLTAVDLLERAEKITKLFPNNNNIENLGMCLGQLSRRESDLMSIEQSASLFEKAVSHAKMFGKQMPKIVSSTIREVSTKYSNELQKGNQTAYEYYEVGIELCRHFANQDLGDEKLYVGTLLESSLKNLFDNKDYNGLRDLCGDISELQQNQFVDIGHFWQNNIMFSEYHKKVNSDDSDSASEIAKIAEYWLQNLYDNTPLEPILSSIVQDNARRNS